MNSFFFSLQNHFLKISFSSSSSSYTSSSVLPQTHVKTPLNKEEKVITCFLAHGGVEVRDSPASGSRKRCFHFWVNGNVAQNNCFRWPPAGRPECTATACRHRKNKFFSESCFFLQLWRKSFLALIVWVCGGKTFRKRWSWVKTEREERGERHSWRGGVRESEWVRERKRQRDRGWER